MLSVAAAYEEMAKLAEQRVKVSEAS
jgi:hypothetical protein